MAIPDLLGEVEGTMLDHFVTEMKTRPFTMIMILAMVVAMFVLWSTQNTFAKTFAKTDDLNRLRVDVVSVKYSVQKASIESQLRQVDEEYFRLERNSADLRAAKKEIPPLYDERMSQLKTDKEALKVELGAVQVHINELTAPSAILVTRTP